MILILIEADVFSDITSIRLTKKTNLKNNKNSQPKIYSKKKHTQPKQQINPFKY